MRLIERVIRRLQCLGGGHQDVCELWREDAYVGLRCDHCGAETVREQYGFWTGPEDIWYASEILRERRAAAERMRAAAARHRTAR